MHGFKSFSNRTELLFGPDFNCILGPNGAGKSNVLDALCFVLGKSSSKSLRAEKSANLIYNGGKKNKPAKKAEVSIFFDNKKRIFPFNYDEIKVTRMLRQNGQSVYKLNDKTVTRQQVIELLSLAKINPDGYNIILQGDIIKFVEMSPNERRQLIEEIAGISVYEERKQKAINDLQKIDEKLKEADIILTERETYLKELKKDKNQASKYYKLKERIDSNKATLIYKQIDKRKKEEEKLNENINKIKTAIDEIKKEIEEKKKELEEKKGKINNINKNIESKGEKDQIKLQKEIEDIKIELTTMKNRVETLKQEITKIKLRKEELKKNLEDIDEKIKRYNIEKNQLIKELDSNKKESEKIKNKISDFKKKHKIEDVNDIEKELENIDKNIETYQEKIQELRQKQQEIFREKDKFEILIKTVDERIEKIKQVENEHKDKIDELKRKREEYKKIKDKLEKELDDNSKIISELETARIKLDSLNQELSKLNTRLAPLKEQILGNNAVKEIISLKDKKIIEGIHGTISELGNSDEKYSLALTIAAGQKINAIVVDNDETAEKCIDHLKEKRIGTATFIPLNKIKKKNVKENEWLLKHEGVVDFAINLIKFDPKYKNAFSYVFGNTLIVDNIKTAREIGIGNIRMVTLDGDIIEISGAMKGGYRTKKRTAFTQNKITDEINETEQEITKYKKIIKTLMERKEKNENEIDNLRRQKAELEAEVIKTEKLLHLQDTDLDASLNEKKEFKEKINKLDKELEKINKEIEDTNNELTQIKIRKQEFKEKISKIRNPTLIAELNAFEEKRQDLREKIIRIESEIKNIDTQINNVHEPEKDNINKIVKQHEKEEIEFKKEIKELNKKVNDKESTLKTQEEKQKKFYKAFRSLFDERDKINSEISKIEQMISDVSEREREKELKLNSLSINHARIVAEISGLEKEFEQYRDIKLDMDKSETQLKKEVTEFENLLQNLGNVNLKALEIYENVEKEYKTLLEKRKKLEKEKDDIFVMMNEIETRKKELFMNTFNKINETFKVTFNALTSKGQANLVLENEEIPFEGGVLIKVRIKGSRYLDIRSLSGGEKTLTALAFIFAIQEHDPAYFYVMDEVDAALDKQNSEKFAKLIKRYSSKAQYIVISHNDGIISEASFVYGVSMNEYGISKVVSLKL